MDVSLCLRCLVEYWNMYSNASSYVQNQSNFLCCFGVIAEICERKTMSRSLGEENLWTCSMSIIIYFSFDLEIQEV